MLEAAAYILHVNRAAELKPAVDRVAARCVTPLCRIAATLTEKDILTARERARWRAAEVQRRARMAWPSLHLSAAFIIFS